ncbi:hypothetical protein Lal_00030232 [Lupinus albus]|nr:hypothetical protein Lal_00030232 [Lupinus albus]
MSDMAGTSDPGSNGGSPSPVLPFPSSSHTAAPLQASPPILNLPLPFIKLTEKNFLVWRQFVLAVLKLNRAERFIAKCDIPVQFLTDVDHIQHHDVSIQANCDFEIIDYCQAQTKSKARQLRSQLHSITKGSSSVSEYFTRIKGLVDSLISIGSPISHVEHINLILDGLCEDLQHVITSLESQNELPSVNAP